MSLSFDCHLPDIFCVLQEEKAERAEAERMRRKQAKQKAKDRLRTEKEKAAAEREAKQKADLEEAQKAATASKERDELERCCPCPFPCNIFLTEAPLAPFPAIHQRSNTLEDPAMHASDCLCYALECTRPWLLGLSLTWPYAEQEAEG